MLLSYLPVAACATFGSIHYPTRLITRRVVTFRHTLFLFVYHVWDETLPCHFAYDFAVAPAHYVLYLFMYWYICCWLYWSSNSSTRHNTVVTWLHFSLPCTFCDDVVSLYAVRLGTVCEKSRGFCSSLSSFFSVHWLDTVKCQWVSLNVELKLSTLRSSYLCLLRLKPRPLRPIGRRLPRKRKNAFVSSVIRNPYHTLLPPVLFFVFVRSWQWTLPNNNSECNAWILWYSTEKASLKNCSFFLPLFFFW